MNDFSELENELKKLRPLQPSAKLYERVQKAMVDPVSEDKIVRPDGFRLDWLSSGLGLAAAAMILLFIRFQFRTSPPQQNQVASNSPAPAASLITSSAEFIPAGAMQIVYNTRDEGLVFPTDSEPPVRRVRSRMRETLQWHNPATGASLRVSYPSEQVELIPVSGQ